MVNVNLEIFSNFMFEYEVIGEAECVRACVCIIYVHAHLLILRGIPTIYITSLMA